MSEQISFPWSGPFVRIEGLDDESMSDEAAERASRVLRYAAANALMLAEPGKLWMRNEQGEWVGYPFTDDGVDYDAGETREQTLMRLYNELAGEDAQGRLIALKRTRDPAGKADGRWYTHLESVISLGQTFESGHEYPGFMTEPMPGETVE